MPLINVFTSSEPRDAAPMLTELSQLLARHTGKPEKWVMTSLVPKATMTFGGSTAPACYVEVKNIGVFVPHETAALSRAVCDVLSRHLDVRAERVYIEFTNGIGHMWGWNGETLGA